MGRRKAAAVKLSRDSTRMQIIPDGPEDMDPLDYLPDEFYALNERQQLFVLGYLRTGNLRQAVEDAGYETKYPRQLGYAMAVGTPHIRLIIDKCRAEINRRRALDALEVHGILSSIGRANLTDVVEWDGAGNLRLRPTSDLDPETAAAIKKIKIKRTIRTTEGGTEEEIDQQIEMHDKVGALDKVARINKQYGDAGVSSNPLFQLLAEVARRNRGEAVDAEFTEEEPKEKKKK